MKSHTSRSASQAPSAVQSSSEENHSAVVHIAEDVEVQKDSLGVVVTDTSDTSSSSAPGQSSDESSTLDGTNKKTNTTTNTNTTTTFSERWIKGVHIIHKPLLSFLHFVTRLSAKYPKMMISGIVSLSFFLLFVGLGTNFSVNVDQDLLWTPRGSVPLQHANWLKKESGFSDYQQLLGFFFHADGENVLTMDYMSQVFDAFEILQNVEGYNEACTGTDYKYQDVETCEISGVPRFWFYDRKQYESSIHSDDELRLALSQINFQDGGFVDENSVLGYPQRDNVTLVGSAYGVNATLLVSAVSYPVIMVLPTHDTAKKFEERALQALLDWQEDRESAIPPENMNNKKLMKFYAQSSEAFTAEFTRGILADMPLVPLVFLIMSAFTCVVFARTNRVFSRSMLGFAAVVSVLLSIMAGYGLLFIVGLPFTSMTQILPFILFGVGIDDAIILISSFSRTDPKTDPVQRIAETIDDCGVSISLTTITSALAFGLSATSSLPAVTWVALTFFVACIVLDERRVSQGRRDCCIWSKAKDFDVNIDKELLDGMHDPFADQIMVWYAEKLLQPRVKFVVAVAFTVLTVACSLSASRLTQQFDLYDILPNDSFIIDFAEATSEYSSRNSVPTRAVFRFVDQSDKEVQQQMLDYMDELIAMDTVSDPPLFFWLWHFNDFVNQTGLGDEVPFNEKLASFLKVQVFKDLYEKEIILDDEGNIVTSRGYYFMDNISSDVRDQIDALYEQRDVTIQQPINQGKAEYPFFSYNANFNIWEFFSRCVSELMGTTIMSVIAVVVVAVLLIPHWTAGIFSLPLVCVLYIDLLGALQWAGIHVNAVSYIGLSMSIGLLVDFVMHVLLRYYEVKGTRREKTIEMLRTMGSSILVGGISTFLGTMPLAFSSTRIFYTIFVTFLGIVTIGMGHGLILLPVILSTIGPEDESSADAAAKAEDEQPQYGSPRKRNIKFEI